MVLRFTLRPTNDLTIQELRVGLLNYIVSMQLNEKLLIRIDDTNTPNNIEYKDKKMIELLSLFSFDCENVVYTSDHLKYHQKMAMQLLTQKKAFSCFCSNEKLEELKQKAQKENQTYSYDGFCSTLSDETVLNVNAPFTVRIQKPHKEISFKTSLKGEQHFLASDVDAFIILKHDKTPTSNYACGIDDMLHNISTIIEEEQYILNSAQQIHIRELLGYHQEIKYTHIPTVLSSNNGNENSVHWLIEQGFLPAALANYLVLISMNTPQEIFTLEEASSWFKKDALKKSDVVFDMDSLRQMNQTYLALMDDMRLSKLLGFADEDIGKLAKLYLKEVSTIKELKKKLDNIFSQKESFHDHKKEFKVIKKAVQSAPFFEDFNDFKKYLSTQTQLQDEALLKPLNYLITGQESQVKIEDVYKLIKNYLGEITK